MPLHQASKKYIFISIPKNASNSVHGILGLDIAKITSSTDDIGILDNHKTCKTIKDRYGEDEFTSRFSFCFVRNPWDRCVSWFKFHEDIAGYGTFPDWIKKGMPHHWDPQEGAYYKPNSLGPVQQYSYICDRQNKVCVDFVGKIESFDTDLEKICAELNIDYAPSEKMNRSERNIDYRQYYTKQTADIVARRLRKDIDLFGYEW